MQATVVHGISMWSVWQPDRNLFFNSFFIEGDGEGDGENLAVDPLPLEPADATEIERHGGIAWIVITNRDHERDARAVAKRFGARIAASALDAPLLSGPVDRELADGEVIGDGTVVLFGGLKTPGEFALHFAARGAALVGDALWGSPAGALRLMPDEKLADPPRAIYSLRKLAALAFDHLLVGDGACIFGGAKRVLRETLAARADAYVNAINRDELTFSTGRWPGAYAKSKACDVGELIGAEKLGYRLDIIEPGGASSPLHWHAAEEELFVVMRGSATLVTPRGETPIRAGDFIAFPTRPDAAHKVVNRTDEPCEVLMVANTDSRDVCYYPDSRKVLIEASELLVRDNPVLEYFDGEPGE